LLLLRSAGVRIRSRFLAAISTAATTATPSRPLAIGLRSRRLLLRRTLLLRRPLLLRTASAAASRTIRPAIASALAWLLLLWTRVRARRLRSATAIVLLAASLPGPLLELLQLALHVLANRPVLPRPHLIETAVRTALPPFGIGLLAG